MKRKTYVLNHDGTISKNRGAADSNFVGKFDVYTLKYINQNAALVYVDGNTTPSFKLFKDRAVKLQNNVPVSPKKSTPPKKDNSTSLAQPVLRPNNVINFVYHGVSRCITIDKLELTPSGQLLVSGTDNTNQYKSYYYNDMKNLSMV